MGSFSPDELEPFRHAGRSILAAVESLSKTERGRDQLKQLAKDDNHVRVAFDAVQASDQHRRVYLLQLASLLSDSNNQAPLDGR